MKRWLVPLLAILAAIGICGTLWGVFVITPMEQTLFFSQKIFYYHLPNAFMLFISVGVCGISSLVFLKTRNPRWDDVASEAGSLAVLFGSIVLITGSIWARAAWGHWWVWENRLTMSLLLWLVMVGYVIVRRFAGAGADRIAAGLAAFATVGVPFIYFGVKSGDQHPQAKVVSSLTGSMQLTLWMSVLTFFVIFLVLMISRVSAARMAREVRELRERGLDAGVLS